ncbi:MAG: hypothetical protein KDJ52_19065 [Anaerolineae bacterium]|nr:hypothetical protein [Anaerolineae bacterium]
MQPRSKIIAGIITALAIVTLGCQSLLDIELPSFGQTTAANISWPHSMFVPPNNRVQIFKGQPLQLETYHLSTSSLSDVQIFVNGLPIRSEETAGTAASPTGLLNVQVQNEQGNLVQTARVTPALPTDKESVSLLVVGNVPGKYDLTLVAVDETGEESTVTQRIEVLDR